MNRWRRCLRVRASGLKQGSEARHETDNQSDQEQALSLQAVWA